MIDWVSFSLPYSGPPVGIQFLKRESWDGPVEPAYNRPVALEGSYSSKLAVQAMGGRLYVSGNPVKWLTGQNVAGTNDLGNLIRRTVREVVSRLGLVDCFHMHLALRDGDVNLTRVDCTFAYQVGSDDDVVAWLMAMERSCDVRFRGRGHFDPGMCSLMFGLKLEEGKKPKASRLSTFKFYNKFREMAVHPPTCCPEVAAQLREKICGTVRGEACYRALELKTYGKDKLKAWTETTALELHREWTGKMNMTEKVELKTEEEKELPRRLQATYHLWRKGVDLRGMLSKPTFYRHLRDLRELGIDISQVNVIQEDRPKVIPILRVLEAKPLPEEENEALFWRLVA